LIKDAATANALPVFVFLPIISANADIPLAVAFRNASSASVFAFCICT
jgi:hypothetical protein